MKKEYRKGLSPPRRRTSARLAIRQSLKGEKKTFSGLLNETELGRSTLAFHLKDMFAKKEVDKETDPKDFRITNYWLRTVWTPEIQKEDDIEALSSMKVDPHINLEEISKITQEISKELWPKVVNDELSARLLSETMKEYASYSMYEATSEDMAEKSEHTKELAEKAAVWVMKELLSELQHLETLPDFAIVIRFRKLRELAQKVKELAPKVEEELLHREELIKLPKKPQ